MTYHGHAGMIFAARMSNSYGIQPLDLQDVLRLSTSEKRASRSLT